MLGTRKYGAAYEDEMSVVHAPPTYAYLLSCLDHRREEVWSTGVEGRLYLVLFPYAIDVAWV